MRKNDRIGRLLEHHIRNVRAAIVTACIMSVACGGTSPAPTAPPNEVPQLRTGPAILSIGTTSESECSGTNGLWLLPGLGASIATRIVLDRSGQDWIGHAASERDGDIELRFRAGAPQIPLTGTIRGNGVHYFDLVTERSGLSKVTIAGTAPGQPAGLEGMLLPSLSVFATISGTITLTDRLGASVTCSRAALLLDASR